MNHREKDPAPRTDAVPSVSAPQLASFTVPVGDVLIRRDEMAYGIFNYRGERVLERSVGTPAEAERIAAEIVAPWHGGVRVVASRVE